MRQHRPGGRSLSALIAATACTLYIGAVSLAGTGCGGGGGGGALLRTLAYVTNGNGTVAQFQVDSAGVLTALTPSTVPAGSAPQGVAVTPDGKLDFMSPTSQSVQAETHSIAVTPDSRYAFVGAGGTFGGAASRIRRFGADPATGALTALGADVLPGDSVQTVAITPDGKHLVSVDKDGGKVFGFSIGADGSLSPTSPPSVTLGGTPYSIAILVE